MVLGIRPTVATVLGVLSIIFGSWATIINVLSVSMHIRQIEYTPVTSIFGLMGLGTSVFQVLVGIQLLTNSNRAMSTIKIFLLIGIFGLLGHFVGEILHYGAAGLIASLLPLLFGLGYYALIFFLLLKSEPVRSWYNSQS